MRSINVNFVFVFVFNLNFGDVFNLKILEMKVPPIVDPRDEFHLSCKFDMNGQKLYSVKWYKDEQEFFRYLPTAKNQNQFFTVPGVHLSNVDCSQKHCDATLDKLASSSTSGAYKCEVSLDAPTFRVAFETKNVTVAALGDDAPKIQGLMQTYMIGDMVSATCTSSASDPAAIITWYINGKIASKMEIGESKVKQNLLGLVTRSVPVSFHAEKRHFSQPEYAMLLTCSATSPALVTHIRNTTIKVHLNQPNLVVKNQKLEWSSSKGIPISPTGVLILGIFLSFYFV